VSQIKSQLLYKKLSVVIFSTGKEIFKIRITNLTSILEQINRSPQALKSLETKKLLWLV